MGSVGGSGAGARDQASHEVFEVGNSESSLTGTIFYNACPIATPHLASVVFEWHYLSRPVEESSRDRTGAVFLEGA